MGGTRAWVQILQRAAFGLNGEVGPSPDRQNPRMQDVTRTEHPGGTGARIGIRRHRPAASRSSHTASPVSEAKPHGPVSGRVPPPGRPNARRRARPTAGDRVRSHSLFHVKHRRGYYGAPASADGRAMASSAGVSRETRQNMLFIASGRVATAYNGAGNALLARLFRQTLPCGHAGEESTCHGSL